MRCIGKLCRKTAIDRAKLTEKTKMHLFLIHLFYFQLLTTRPHAKYPFRRLFFFLFFVSDIFLQNLINFQLYTFSFFPFAIKQWEFFVGGKWKLVIKCI